MDDKAYTVLKNPYTDVKNLYTDAKSMSDAIYREMQGYVHAAAEPRPAGDSVKAAIGRAARELRLSVRRVTTYWYGYHCQVLAEELDRARRAHDARLERRMARLSHELAVLQALHAELHDDRVEP